MALVGCARVDGARRDAAIELSFVEPSRLAQLGAGAEDLGPVPLLVRPLRLGWATRALGVPSVASALLPKAPLVMPFGGRRKPAVREIAVRDPRISRLWERFCIDIGCAVERDAAFVTKRIFSRLEDGYRVLILEDGDRYAIRAMCIFIVKSVGDERTGYVMELLHDRSVAGMRAASHLLGLSVREMASAGAGVARAYSLTHSGSFPIYARHAFLPVPARALANEPHVVVRAVDADLGAIAGARDRWYLSYLDTDV